MNFSPRRQSGANGSKCQNTTLPIARSTATTAISRIKAQFYLLPADAAPNAKLRRQTELNSEAHQMRQLVLSFTLACAALAQSTSPAFEVASVKPAAISGRGVRASMRGGPGTSDPVNIAFTNVTLMSVLLRAYDTRSWQVIAPDWLSSERYDIAATVPPGSTAALSKEQFNLMLQHLLSDRFHLILHRETRQISGYELIAPRGSSKLKPSNETGPAMSTAAAPAIDAEGFPQLTSPGLVIMEGMSGKAVVSYVAARAQPLSALADLLSKEFRLPVLDNTGLRGQFDFRIMFAPQAPGALPPENSEDSAANLISAVPQQLGLKLNRRTIAVDVFVVDAADRIPTAN